MGQHGSASIRLNLTLVTFQDGLLLVLSVFVKVRPSDECLCPSETV